MRIDIDLGSYRRNLDRLQRRLEPAKLMAVVKDDAYGHGLESIIPAALESGISMFAVLDIDTGLRVRSLVTPVDIQLFAWLFRANENFAAAIEANIDLGVSNVSILESIASAAEDRPARVHLKIDSGLHRNGASVQSWPELVASALSWEREGRIIVVGVWTHIGEASDEDDNRSQSIFESAVAYARSAGLDIQQQHLAASAASYARPEFRYDFCRVGGFTYGVAPGDGIGPAELDLEAVMTAKAQVCDVTNFYVDKTFQLEAGFLDGIPDWVLEGGGISQLPQPGFEVLVGSERLAILSVEATRLVIDGSKLDQAPTVGQWATLFGSHVRNEPVLQEWADALGTVGEEIVVRVGQRNERFYC